VKHAIRSASASSDIVAAVEHYPDEAPHAAAGFIDELERAVRHIERHPASGSPRYSHELDIPRLRHGKLKRFPFALFYLEYDEHLLVIRCVHLNRDIPSSLQEE
jgi:toxin ParE1/3/4